MPSLPYRQKTTHRSGFSPSWILENQVRHERVNDFLLLGFAQRLSLTTRLGDEVPNLAARYPAVESSPRPDLGFHRQRSGIGLGTASIPEFPHEHTVTLLLPYRQKEQ